MGGMSPAHRESAPTPLEPARAPGLRLAMRLVNRARWERWERGSERRLARLSERFYERIHAGGSGWLSELT